MFKGSIKAVIESYVNGVPYSTEDTELPVDVQVDSVIVYGGKEAKVSITCAYRGQVVRLMEARFDVLAGTDVLVSADNAVLTHPEFLTVSKV